jgi:hypothetical protein
VAWKSYFDINSHGHGVWVLGYDLQPFFLSFNIVATWAVCLTFGHIGLTIHTLFPLLFNTLDVSPNTRPEFYAAFAHTIIIISSQSLPFRNCLLVCSYSFSYTLSIKYPYRPQASAAAAICLKQYHIPLNQFLSFVSLYIRRGNGVLGSLAEYDRPFLFVILGCLCLVDSQKGSTGRLLGDGRKSWFAYWRMYKKVSAYLPLAILSRCIGRLPTE